MRSLTTLLSRALHYRVPLQSRHRPYKTLSVMVNLFSPPLRRGRTTTPPHTPMTVSIPSLGNP